MFCDMCYYSGDIIFINMTAYMYSSDVSHVNTEIT